MRLLCTGRKFPGVAGTDSLPYPELMNASRERDEDDLFSSGSLEKSVLLHACMDIGQQSLGDQVENSSQGRR